MVQLTITSVIKAAIDEYCKKRGNAQYGDDEDSTIELTTLAKAEVGGPIEHHNLVQISKYLVHLEQSENSDAHARSSKRWRVDTLLKGANVYSAPPPPKKEPTADYKALMLRLRKQEEQRQYERMVNPFAPPETFGQRFPNSSSTFNPATSHGASAIDEVDDVTYADVNRQMILIINVLISIITCSVFIWVAARRWSVPSRLALSMSGSGLVAFAEIAIYFGYLRRLQDARQLELKQVEKKEIVQSWVSDKADAPVSLISNIEDNTNGTRLRKSKHR